MPSTTLSITVGSPLRLALISLEAQCLRLWEDGRLRYQAIVSTAAVGASCREGSGGTPTGWHRIAAVIGRGEPLGMRFSSREPVGLWDGEACDEDLILTRIFRLEGLEEGHNCGLGCDSFERYIYLHGTNHEGALGQPVSHGCIRLSNQACLELEAWLGEGDLVHIA